MISELEDISDLITLSDFKKLKGYKYSYRLAFHHNSVKYRVCMNIVDNEICIEKFLKRDRRTYKIFP